jgi:monooxygenase
MPREHVDVLIVGAGLSGIGAACRLQERCPGRTFTVLEARDAIGGTWDLFRFPGMRSDSDMFTLSYPFRPWSGAQGIVDGSTICEYIRSTAREHDIERRIRFGHRVVSASWRSEEDRWEVEAERTDTGEIVRLSCGWLFSCTGYYRYDVGYTPDFPGIEHFGGELVHPQFWTDALDHAGKRIVVIGSGATAVTLVPALAGEAAHVTMLQRSPSYVLSLPAVDPVARVLGVLPGRLSYPLVRWKNVLLTLAVYGFSRRQPRAMRWLLRKQCQRRLPAGYDVDRHFKPAYDPWDQRMCVVPDGDFFEAIATGRLSVVTDRIETFTETGIRLASGAELEADMIVTATGLEMIPCGGVELRVDGEEVELGDALVFRGMLLSGVPNMAYSFGYTNQSWTLGSDLTCREVCRILNHMERNGYTRCVARAAPQLVPAPLMDLSSGYVRRAIDKFPKQGSSDPWRREQNYARNRRAFRRAPVEDAGLEFSCGPEGAAAKPVAA